MDRPEIHEIIKNCLNGRRDSFSRIVGFYQERIYRLCFQYTRTNQDAEDAATDIFLKVFKSLSSFDTERNFSTWLFTIAVNHMNDIMRKKKREKRILAIDMPARTEMLELNTPEDVLIKETEKKFLNEAVNALPFKLRTALMLKYHNGLSYEQISEIMDIPVNTVGSFIFRGKKELREKIRQSGELNEMLR